MSEDECGKLKQLARDLESRSGAGTRSRGSVDKGAWRLWFEGKGLKTEVRVSTRQAGYLEVGGSALISRRSGQCSSYRGLSARKEVYAT